MRPQTPVIIFTGSLSEDIAVDCMKAGAVNYIIKENVKRLGVAVVHALEERELRIERKRVEEALRASVSIFNGFLEQSRDAVMLTDERGMVTQWSRGAERLTGYAREETIGMPLWDVQFRSMPHEHKSTENHENLKQALQAALVTGHGPFLNRFVESVLEQPGGLRLTVQTSAFSIQTPDGFLLGGILRDTTERRQAEAKLEEDRILLRTLIDSLPDRIYVMDEQGRTILSNKADWQAAGAKTMEEVLGKTDLETYPPELAEGVLGG